MSWRQLREESIYVDSIDVSAPLKRWQVNHTYSTTVSTATLVFSKRALDNILTLSENLTVVVYRNYMVGSTPVKTCVFSGYIKDYEDTQGIYTINAEDKLVSLSKTNLNKVYAPVSALPVSDVIREMIYDAGLTAGSTTVTTTTTEIQGYVCKGRQAYDAIKTLCDSLGYHLYYDPRDDNVHAHPLVTGTTPVVTYERGVNTVGTPNWGKDLSTLYNDITVISADVEKETEETFVISAATPKTQRTKTLGLMYGENYTGYMLVNLPYVGHADGSIEGVFMVLYYLPDISEYISTDLYVSGAVLYNGVSTPSSWIEVGVVWKAATKTYKFYVKFWSHIGEDFYETTLEGTTVIQLSKIYRIAVTWDTDSGGNTFDCALWVNGVTEASDTGTGTMEGYYTDGNQAQIQGTGAEFGLGIYFADFRIYKDVRTPAELVDWAYLRLSGAELTDTDLEGYWKIDEGSDIYLSDSSTYGNTAEVIPVDGQYLKWGQSPVAWLTDVDNDGEYYLELAHKIYRVLGIYYVEGSTGTLYALAASLEPDVSQGDYYTTVEENLVTYETISTVLLHHNQFNSDPAHKPQIGETYLIQYSYKEPYYANQMDPVSITAYGQRSKTITRTDLNTQAAVNAAAAAYIEQNSMPATIVKLQAAQDPAALVMVGDMAALIDLNNYSAGLLVNKLVMNFPKKHDEVTLGDVRVQTSDYIRSLEARISSLESTTSIMGSTAVAEGYSSDEEVLFSNGSMQKKKEFILAEAFVCEYYTVSFDIHGPSTWGRVYKNGSAIGTLQYVGEDSYTTFSQTFSGPLAAGDKIQFYGMTWGSGRVRNFRMVKEV